MCNQCYRKHGRTKKAWKCKHEKLYAHGLCQNCYINAYNQVIILSLTPPKPIKKSNQKLKYEGMINNSIKNDGFLGDKRKLLISTISTKEPLTIKDNAAFNIFKTPATNSEYNGH